MAPHGLTRRELLKSSGAALGGLAVAGALLEPSEARAALACEGSCYPPADEAERQRYSYFQKQLPGLKYYQDRGDMFPAAAYPPLEPDEMRITFMGSTIPPTRRAQQMMSIFVEVGWDPVRKRAKDQFVFDCGAGVVANYGAMDVGFGRMDKIFVTHLHGDHVSDMTHVYCFGLCVGPAVATLRVGTRTVRESRDIRSRRTSSTTTARRPTAAICARRCAGTQRASASSRPATPRPTHPRPRSRTSGACRSCLRPCRTIPGAMPTRWSRSSSTGARSAASPTTTGNGRADNALSRDPLPQGRSPTSSNGTACR